MVQILNLRSKSAASARVRRRNDARRLDILRAASRVFRRHGVADAGMREIAEEADLSPGNLYYYFRSKHELLYFCQDRTLTQMHAAIEQARATGAGVAEQLSAVLKAHVNCVLDETEGATAHLEIDALPAGLRAEIVAKRDRYERAVRALVSKGIKGGEFATCDAALVTRAMLGAVNWTARWYRPDGRLPVAEIAAALAAYLVRGLAASGAVKHTRAKIAAGGGK
jgi:TetR/AcrR family transcriptional regulator